MKVDDYQWAEQLKHEIKRNVQIALEEDLLGQPVATGDITANLIDADTQATASIITREPGVFCGQAWLDETYQQLDKNIVVEWLVQDGDAIQANQQLCKLQGQARALLTGERTALNFIQMLSAVATQTKQYVQAVAGSSCKILDTRKTIPCHRFGQKYAVVCGGGQNHRMGLFDAYLIKENHITACGSIAQAVSKARNTHPDKLLEVEVENLDELQQAIEAGVDVVMLDNFSEENTNEAIALIQSQDSKVKVEKSGNLDLKTMIKSKHRNIDYISIGKLTKSVVALDLSFSLKLAFNYQFQHTSV